MARVPYVQKFFARDKFGVPIAKRKYGSFGGDGAGLERDPVAFVYIPKTNQHLISGRFAGDATILVTSANNPAGADFTITKLAAGRWELKMPNGGPDKGVLIISPEGGLTLNQDNVVTYQANDARDGWIIESRDLPGTLPPLEDLLTQPVANFVYIPGSTPGFVVTPASNLFTSESGTTATFTVSLETKPKADVTINISSSNTAEGTVAPASITFTTNDWNVAQTITVTGADDANTDGPVTYNIVLAAATSTDADYNGRNPLDPVVINIDNEGGITVNPTGGLSTTEAGGTAAFTVRLTQAPTADVTIGLSSSDITEGAISTPSLTFTSANWDQDQTVQITGLDDSLDDGDITFTIITANAVSSDPFFNNRVSADVTVINTDDDTAGVIVTPTTGLSMVESAGTATYGIVLRSQPASDVVITTQTSDTTEGTAAPATLTFTPANWNAEQIVTITGINDNLVDGNVLFSVTNKLSSTDPVYAAFDPLDVTVTSLDDEAVITFPDSVINYGLGMPAVPVALRATIVDPNTPSYDTGTLRVSVTGAGTDDRLDIRSSGTGPGQISVENNQVLFEGLAIGSVTGAGSGDLVVTFNGNSTPAGAQALLRAITYRNVGTANATRQLQIALTEGGATVGGSVTVQVGLLRVIEFQEGADFGNGVYTGAADIELNEAAPDEAFPIGRNNNGLYLNVETESDGQVLLRFDNLIGNGPNQIPTNSIIVSAELHLDINEGGFGAAFHRMLVPWNAETDTWNSLGGGIPQDDIKSRTVAESQIGGGTGSGGTGTGNVWVGVTPDVQAWVNGGEPNFGWVFISDVLINAAGTTTNSTSFSPSEAANIADRPRLRVTWLPKDSSTLASFRQGVNEYAGTVDTRIVETEANRNTDYTTSLSRTFVDAINTGSTNNQGQVLIRFDDIFGSDSGQIPPGARIEAAVLDLASLGNDAPGDGAMFYALLQPWPEVNTWNGWSDGVQTNSVEAAATPSFLLGNATLAPDAQGGYFSFLLTPDVQAWADGSRTNVGWALIPWPGGGNGWAVALSEFATESARPRLRVYYTADAAPTEIKLDTPVRTATTLQLTFTGAPSTAHSIYRSETVDGTFTKIGDATTGADGRGTFTDNAPPPSMAFYTIRRP